MPEPGLRERKKAKLRAELVDTADDLFIERGFDDVTLEDIAAQCEVSVRTLLRYFPSKEALALAYELDLLERFRAGLDRRQVAVLDYWRDHVRVNSVAFAERADWHRRRYTMLRELPLYAALEGIRGEYQRLLAGALVDERMLESDLAGELLAASLVAGNFYTLRKFLDGAAAFEPVALLDVIDFAVDLFTGR